MSKILAKVDQLIALANSSHSEEEARTSALLAVRFIAKHKLTVMTTWETPPDPVAPPPPPPEPEAEDQGEYAPLYTGWKLGDPLRSKDELRYLVELKIQRLYIFFKRMKKRGEYPFRSIPMLVNQELKAQRLDPEEKASFTYYLSCRLHTEKVCGRLDSIPSKGYCLASRRKKT